MVEPVVNQISGAVAVLVGSTRKCSKRKQWGQSFSIMEGKRGGALNFSRQAFENIGAQGHQTHLETAHKSYRQRVQ
jgi:hypothetical protein